MPFPKVNKIPVLFTWLFHTVPKQKRLILLSNEQILYGT